MQKQQMTDVKLDTYGNLVFSTTLMVRIKNVVLSILRWAVFGSVTGGFVGAMAMTWVGSRWHLQSRLLHGGFVGLVEGLIAGAVVGLLLGATNTARSDHLRNIVGRRVVVSALGLTLVGAVAGILLAGLTGRAGSSAAMSNVLLISCSLLGGISGAIVGHLILVNH
jgi:hypothetical protein